MREYEHKVSEEQIREAIAEGLDRPEMAKKFGVKAETITLAAKRWNIELPKTKRFVDLVEKDVFQELIDKDYTAVDMAEELKLNVTTVRRYLTKYGLKPHRARAHRVKSSIEDELMRDAIYIDHPRKVNTVIVDGKSYTNIFELLWEDPKPYNPYARLDTHKKKVGGLYG